MNFKHFTSLTLSLFILINTSILFPQHSQSDKPQSAGNKETFRNNSAHNSTITNPSELINHKKKDFTINQKESTQDKTKRKDYQRKGNGNNSKINRSENYFHIDKSGKTLWDGKHWNIDEFPLKVHIEETSSRHYNSDYKKYVSYAFKLWQKADSRIQYVFTNNSRNADIEFVFVENLGKNYEENYLGLTDYDTNTEKEIEHAKVQISLVKFGNDKVSAGEIKATIIHELGHAFGLGHSENELDIMYPYISSEHSSKMTYDELSRGDTEAIEDVIDLGTGPKYVWK